MPAKRVDVTDEQRDEMLDHALEAIRAGASARSALKAAAELHGVSAVTVRRWGEHRGRPVTRSNATAEGAEAAARTAAASQARRAYSLEDLRRLQHDTTALLEAAVGAIQADVVVEGVVDPVKARAALPDLSRASVILGRTAAIDEKLDKRGALIDPGEREANEREARTAALAHEVEAAERGFTLLRGGKA